MRKLFGLALCMSLLLAVSTLVSCSSENDNFEYPHDEYGVYIIQTSGGDLGRFIAKYGLSLYPYIAIEGWLKYEDFEMLKHMQTMLMYLNLEKVNINSYKSEKLSIKNNIIHQDHMLKDGTYAFPLLKTIILPKGLNEIGEKAFYGSNISELTMFNGLMKIGANAFENCKLLENIDLPNNLTYIGKEAFKGCVALSRIVIPSSVSEMYENTFDNRYVKSIHIKSKIPPVLNASPLNIARSGSVSKRPTIYVPQGAKYNYDSHSEWNKYVILEE